MNATITNDFFSNIEKNGSKEVNLNTIKDSELFLWCAALVIKIRKSTGISYLYVDTWKPAHILNTDIINGMEINVTVSK